MAEKKVMNDYQAEKFLSKYVPVSENQLVKSVNEIKISPPLVLKIISDEALHKSDIGGVKFVTDKDNIKKYFNDLLRVASNRKIKLQGIMAQKFYSGEQLIIGIKKDPVFNHVILFGVGGVFTEIFEDTSIRKCPIDINDAEEMIDELKAAKIFHGFRGKKLNTKLLKKVLIKVSQIPGKYKNIKEMDINPFMLNEKEGVVVDARILFE